MLPWFCGVLFLLTIQCSSCCGCGWVFFDIWVLLSLLHGNRHWYKVSKIKQCRVWARFVAKKQTTQENFGIFEKLGWSKRKINPPGPFCLTDIQINQNTFISSEWSQNLHPQKWVFWLQSVFYIKIIAGRRGCLSRLGDIAIFFFFYCICT